MEASTWRGIRAEYHSCLFTAISLDAEWTRRTHFDGNSTDHAIDVASKAIRARCTQFKKRVDENRVNQGLPGPQTQAEEIRWNSLYNPLEYVPLANEDSLSLVIFDDFAPLVSVTSRCPTTVEEVSMGYLPKLESLAQNWTTADQSSIERARQAFGEPEIIFGGQDKLPSLMMLSRYKVNGIGSLGVGSLHHIALMRAMVCCIGRTLAQMEFAATVSDPQLMAAFEITLADLQATRFIMVDLLGQEELGLVFFVPNWSIASGINSRLQCLKFEEVIAADTSGCLKEEFLASDWLKSVCDFSADITPRQAQEGLPPVPADSPEQLFDKIQHAHPLRWVRSTPCVRRDLFSTSYAERQDFPIHGWIDATTHLRLAPGHQSKMDGLIEEVRHRRPDPFPSIQLRVQQGGSAGETSPDHFTIHQLGASDLALPHHDLVAYDKNLLVPVRHFLSQVHNLMDSAAGSDPGLQSHGRSIVGLTNFCGIPVPVLTGADGVPLLNPGYDTKHHIAVLEIILPVLKRRLMLAEKPTEDTRPEAADRDRVCAEWDLWLKDTNLPPLLKRPHTWGSLSAADIGDKTRLCGLPQPLVRTLEFVYHNFTTLLANPFAFDSVLDLYDIFAAFHRALTQELPKLCDKERYGYLDKERVDMIARLIDAVHRALNHRMYRLFPENSHRDMDIDFRGGLNALVYSADGILKLGVGVLRHHVLKGAVEDRARVGVVTRIGFRQGITAVALRLGVESEARLGIVETDVPHLYHLPSYVDFLHEAFHLVYDAARNPGSDEDIPPMLPTVPRGSEDLTIDGRLAEIFSNMLTALFVCPDDPELLTEHMAIQYATRHMRETDDAVVGNFIEFTCLLYIVCQSLVYLKDSRAAQTAPAPWWYCPDAEEENLINSFDPQLSAAGFKAFYKEHLPFFSTRLSKKFDQLEAMQDQVGIIFEEIYLNLLQPFVPIVVAKACVIYSRNWFRSSGRLLDAKRYQDFKWWEPAEAHDLPTLTAAWDHAREQLVNEVHRISDKEQPCYSPFSFLTWRDPKNPAGRLDPMIFVGVLLREILRSRSLDMKHGKGPHHVPNKGGAPCFEGYKVAANSQEQPRYFIQRGVSALFTSDLSHRAHRLGSRIAMLKMFGDMACLLRSKRFSEMLRHSLSEPPAQT